MPITYTRVQSLVHGLSCPNLIGYRNIFSAISLDDIYYTLIHISRTRSSTNYAKFREWTRDVYKNVFHHKFLRYAQFISYAELRSFLNYFFSINTLNTLHMKCVDFIFFHSKQLFTLVLSKVITTNNIIFNSIKYTVFR